MKFASTSTKVICDQIGIVLGYADESGAVVASYSYDAYGNLLSSSGPMSAFFRHRFSTKLLDPDTGLYYSGHRWYSPALGRWISRDPIEEEGGENLYGFCDNNAIVQMDPDGKNIYLLQGGDSWNPIINHLHQSVAVDLWTDSGEKTGRKTSFTYAEHGMAWRAPSSKWLGTDSMVLPGYLIQGMIAQREPVGTVIAEKETTCVEDKRWLRKMQGKVGITDVYSPLRHNCRVFSQKEFESAPGKRIK